MGSAFDFGHKLWVATQLRAPGWVQDRIVPHVYNVKDLLGMRHYLTVHRLHGQNQDGPLTVDYVGLHHKPDLTNALFTAEAAVQAVAKVPLWRVADWTERTNSDLIVIIGSNYLIRQLPRRQAIVLPFLVKMGLDVRGNWDKVRGRLHKSVRKNELRLMRKYNYEYELSNRDQDFDLFYHKMYVPTIELRKGDLASPMSKREAFQYFRYGSLLQLIKRDGQYVAGGLSYVQDQSVKFRLMGILDADEALFHEGALAACYYAIVEWANHHDYREVVFGECVPRLRNGVFQYKRKWGGTVSYSAKVHRQIWIKIQHNTAAVRRFFKDNPFIITNQFGQLQGLIVVEDPAQVSPATRNVWNDQYATPGLAGLMVCSAADLVNGKAGSGKTEPDMNPLLQVTE